MSTVIITASDLPPFSFRLLSFAFCLSLTVFRLWPQIIALSFTCNHLLLARGQQAGYPTKDVPEHTAAIPLELAQQETDQEIGSLQQAASGDPVPLATLSPEVLLLLSQGNLRLSQMTAPLNPDPILQLPPVYGLEASTPGQSRVFSPEYLEPNALSLDTLAAALPLQGPGGLPTGLTPEIQGHGGLPPPLTPELQGHGGLPTELSPERQRPLQPILPQSPSATATGAFTPFALPTEKPDAQGTMQALEESHGVSNVPGAGPSLPRSAAAVGQGEKWRGRWITKVQLCTHSVRVPQVKFLEYLESFKNWQCSR